MFSGIVESMATIVAIKRYGENVDFTLTCPFTNELKIDQSISHNGVCLTVVNIDGDRYTVTAMKETLVRSNLGLLKVGDKVSCIIDSAPFKQGKIAPGSHVPIVSPEEGAGKKPDCVLIVAPGYTGEIAGLIRRALKDPAGFGMQQVKIDDDLIDQLAAFAEILHLHAEDSQMGVDVGRIDNDRCFFGRCFLRGGLFRRGLFRIGLFGGCFLSRGRLFSTFYG